MVDVRVTMVESKRSHGTGPTTSYPLTLLVTGTNSYRCFVCGRYLLHPEGLVNPLISTAVPFWGHTT